MNMRYATTLTLVVLLAFAGACKRNENKGPGVAVNEQQTSVQKAQELTPEELGALGAQIRKTPDHATDLLREHGLTQQSFEAQIRKVTESPEASKRYAEAYRKASA